MSDLKQQLEIIKQGIEEIIGEDDLVQKLKDNKINLLYYITLGEKAKIQKISFIGNKVFKDKKLKGVIYQL